MMEVHEKDDNTMTSQTSDTTLLITNIEECINNVYASYDDECLYEGQYVYDHKGDLREVRKVRVLITRPVKKADSHNQIIKKAIGGAIRLVKAWKQSKAIQCAMDFVRDYIDEDTKDAN